jgi:hypothetical protein
LFWELAISHGLQFLWRGPRWRRSRGRIANQGFGALSGISITVTCLAINQAAYVVGRIRANDGPEDGSVEDHLPQQRADDEPQDGRDDDIRRQHEQQQNSQFKLAQLTNQRQADLTP